MAYKNLCITFVTVKKLRKTGIDSPVVLRNVAALSPSPFAHNCLQ